MGSVIQQQRGVRAPEAELARRRQAWRQLGWVVLSLLLLLHLPVLAGGLGLMLAPLDATGPVGSFLARCCEPPPANLSPRDHLVHAVRFFGFETVRVFLLLVVVLFVVGVIGTFLTPARTRQWLLGRGQRMGTVLAALLGMVTPFCSCSAVSLFIGLVSAGVPLGVTFAFLVAAPMVNEVALVMLWALSGWQVALLYAGAGLAVAIGAGWMIGACNPRHQVEDWVLDFPSADGVGAAPDWVCRVEAGSANVRRILGRVWLYVVCGIGAGAIIHGYVPEQFMAGLLGRDSWWAVPAGVLLGVPMYSNAAGVIPIVQGLLAKGAALGTALAFMMAVTALSLPEMIILRKVLKPPLLAGFFGLVALGILLVGYLFNILGLGA